MKKTQAVVAPKRSYAPIPVEIVNELKTLAAQNNGLLRPEIVVEAARAGDSPLHARFEWDDSAAAEKFRIIQARFLLSVSVQYLPQGNKQVPTKVFVSLSTDRAKHENSCYRLFVDVMGNSDQRNQLLQDCLASMTHFHERYRQLSELKDVFKTMDKVKPRIRSRITRRKP